MLDILGAITLTSIAILGTGTLIFFGAQDRAERIRLAVIAALWFLAVAGLAAAGVFSNRIGFGTPAIGAAVAIPIVAGSIAFARSRSARAFAMGVPLAVLVGLHAGRLLGGFFLALHEAGRLPPTFALTAGWGDVFIAGAAVPLAWAIQRRAPGWWALALAWNAIGLADLLTAVSLGVGSAAGSPARFVFETPDSGLVGTLPWLLIPGFLVPIYMLTHVAVFMQLAARAANPGERGAPWRGLRVGAVSRR